VATDDVHIHVVINKITRAISESIILVGASLTSKLKSNFKPMKSDKAKNVVKESSAAQDKSLPAA
jgi:hypothetical protein